jgi:CubicO group peptidase (beta-lactamase class C family)
MNTRQFLVWAFLPMAGLLTCPAIALGNWYSMQTSNFKDRTKLQETISNYAENNTDIDEIAVTPAGEWVIIAGAVVVASDSFPAFTLQKIKQYIDAGKKIDVVSFAPNGSWVVVAEGLHWRSSGLPHPEELEDKIKERLDAGKRIDEIQFTSNGTGWVIISGSWAWSKNVPDELFRAVRDRNASKRRIQGISIGEGNRWAVYADQWIATSGANSTMLARVKSWPAEKKSVSLIRFGLDSNYIMFSNGTYSPSPASEIASIEYGLGDGTVNIYRRMQETNVPGLSLAIIDGNEITYARAYGELLSGTERFASASNPFDAASLSKYIAAVGLLRLGQEGKISLDTTVTSIASMGGAGNSLTAWKNSGEILPQSYGISPAVTLPSTLTMRRLLSHTAGMKPWSSTGIDSGSWPASQPSTPALLLGFNCDNTPCGYGNGHVVWYDPALGTPYQTYNYSGGGYLVVQAAIEFLSNLTFPVFMQQRVFGPLGFEDSLFVLSPPSAQTELRLAAHHDSDGDPRSRRIYPWAAAGGLYASPRDYAKAMIPLLNLGNTEGGQPFLTLTSVSNILTDVTSDSVNFGLGVRLSQSIVSEAGGAFKHTGSHPNRAYSRMLGSPARNQGIVVMVNAGHDAAQDLVDEVVKAFCGAYGWDTADCI